MKDTLDYQQQNYNLSGNQRNARYAMQNLYRLQLDEVMNQKNKVKERERQQFVNQKKQFTQKAIQNQQEERMKEKAYKNYYEMLSKNQQENKNKFISPYSLGDSLKNSHIQHSIEQGQIKLQQFQLYEKQRQVDAKNRYREELRNQIEEKRKYDQQQRQMKRRSQEEFQRFGKLPSELNKYERVKQKEEMAKYKEDLDKIKNKNQEISRSRSQRHIYKVPDGQHNILTNPLPYNIQNKYIIQQMQRDSYKNNKAINEFSRSPIV